MTWTLAPRGGARLGLGVVSAAISVLIAGCGVPPEERVDETADLIPANATMAVVVTDLASLAER